MTTVYQGNETVEVKSLTVIHEQGQADSRIVLEEDENGLLYETNNAVTRQLVNSSQFIGWEGHTYSDEWLDELTEEFGSREVAERYQSAANDTDK